MEANNPDRPLVAACLTAWLVCACLAAATLAASEEPAPPAAKPKEDAAAAAPQRKTVLYKLNHARAEIVAKLLREKLSPLEAASTSFGTDERTNGVVVSAPDNVQRRVADLIAEIDVLDDGQEQIKVFHLVNAEATLLAKTVAEVLNTDRLKIAVDPRTNSIVASGDPHALEVLEAILLRLDEDKGPTKSARVRIVWLASGLSADAGTEPAEDLKPVVADLAAVGVTGLRQVGQAVVNTLPDVPFQMRCLPMYEKGPAEMQLEGTFQDQGGRPMMDIQVSARQIVAVPDPRVCEPVAGDKDARVGVRINRQELVELHTQIEAPYGQYVVVGVTPVEKANSVFVVQVTRGE
jgi:hypothetical protein